MENVDRKQARIGIITCANAATEFDFRAEKTEIRNWLTSRRESDDSGQMDPDRITRLDVNGLVVLAVRRLARLN
jgi:hypothetical protein